MITRFGMGQSLGQVAYEDEPHRFLGNAPMPGMLERRYSEATAERIDEAVRELIEVAFGKAASLLRERREVLDKTAEALLATETLTGEELKVLFDAERSDSAESVPAAATSSVSSLRCSRLGERIDDRPRSAGTSCRRQRGQP